MQSNRYLHNYINRFGHICVCHVISAILMSRSRDWMCYLSFFFFIERSGNLEYY